MSPGGPKNDTQNQKRGYKKRPPFWVRISSQGSRRLPIHERDPKQGPENVPKNGVDFWIILAAFSLRRGRPLPPVSTACTCRLWLPCASSLDGRVTCFNPRLPLVMSRQITLAEPSAMQPTSNLPCKWHAHAASNKTRNQRVLAGVFASFSLLRAARVHKSCDPHFGVEHPSQTLRHISLSTEIGYEKRPLFFAIPVSRIRQDIIQHASKTRRRFRKMLENVAIRSRATH